MVDKISKIKQMHLLTEEEKRAWLSDLLLAQILTKESLSYDDATKKAEERAWSICLDE